MNHGNVCCGYNPMNEVLTDVGMLEMAERMAARIREGVYDARVAESSRRLFVACAALLRDWFKDEDLTPCGMESLLSMALHRGKYNSWDSFRDTTSALDLMFRQIEVGLRYAIGPNGEWLWYKSRFVRKCDGARPGDTGGMPPGTDIAASYYASWRCSGPPEVLEESIHACIWEIAALGISSGGYEDRDERIA